MNVVLNKTIGLGDSGLPFSLIIDVEYERKGNHITVFSCLERQTPYDNPPESWYRRMEEIVSEYFYEQDEELNVSFDL